MPSQVLYFGNPSRNLSCSTVLGLVSGCNPETHKNGVFTPARTFLFSILLLLTTAFNVVALEVPKLAANKDYVQKTTQTQKQIAEKPKEEKKVAWLYQQGLSKLENKDWLGAISDFTKLLMLDPQHKEAKAKNRQARIGYYYEEALHNIKQSKWKAAKEHLQNLLSLAPKHTGAKEKLFKVRKHLQVPKTKGKVTDYANILSGEEEALLGKQLIAYEIVILTIESLAGENIETYSQRVFNKWGVGKKNKGKGVLIPYIQP